MFRVGQEQCAPRPSRSSSTTSPLLSCSHFLVAAPNEQGQRAQRAHKHGVGLPRAQRQHRPKQGRHIQGRPRHRPQGRYGVMCRQHRQQHINQPKARNIQRRLPQGAAQPGPQNNPPRRCSPAAAPPRHHGIHHRVQADALALFTPARRVSRHHCKYERQQRHTGLIQPKLSAQGKHQQKAQAAIRRHHAAKFQRVKPEQFDDYAKGESQRPVAGKKAREQGQTDGAVYKANDAG